MDEHWSYKNFNMVVELDIAGEFIYNGIHEIYRVSHFANDGSTFTALYDTSVGIERLQKSSMFYGEWTIMWMKKNLRRVLLLIAIRV